MEDKKAFFDHYFQQFNKTDFIANDPISVPHAFHKKQDIEIAAFFASIFAWGQRKTIINKATDLMNRMDNAPHDFIIHHEEGDLKGFLDFKHRTFQTTDLLYFLSFLQSHYRQFESLEEAFFHPIYCKAENDHVARLNGFHDYVFSLSQAPDRTRKHLSAPYRKSCNKRINMFLRWMVRDDGAGVDFGLWNRIQPADLYIPLDVHVEKIARRFSLLQRRQKDWKAVVEITEALRKWDKSDPVKYDFALFGLSISEKLA